jgi:hypothetical protein
MLSPPYSLEADYIATQVDIEYNLGHVLSSDSLFNRPNLWEGSLARVLGGKRIDR